MTDTGGVTGHIDGVDKPEPKESKWWLAQIEQAEHDFKDWQERADNIDKVYADLRSLAEVSRDRQFQMFWANIQVLGPSIYSRPPIPVVTPRFKDRKPVPRMASELLERSTIVGFESPSGNIDGVMRQVRDDLTVLARGCAWVRYDTKKGQKVCIERTNRRDFLTNAARTWEEVDWVSKRSWLSEDEFEKRFKDVPKEKLEQAAYEDRKVGDTLKESERKVGVWEIWCKSQNKVVWVTPGIDIVLDEGEPHLELEGFFPCPKPAYSTTQRDTLIPVPDMLFYKDQLEEINELTARIGALSDAVKVRGFYPAGAGEAGDAIEAAIKALDNNVILVPLANAAALSGTAFKDAILWMPIDMIVATIKELVGIRQQLITDVYEITGLSDIMRGATDANETLGAQELKSQYGSVRIKDRQQELVRFARDLVRISAEIMAENFSQKTLLEMSQLDIETDADIRKKVKPLEDQIKQIIAQVEKAKADPQMQAQAQQNPQAAQQMLQQAQQQAEGLKKQIDKLNDTATIEKVMKLLRDQKTRPFVLDIETDSTIAPDENAQKQRATEFVTAVGGYMGQVIPMVQQVPQAAKLAAETLKYVASQFRAGRELEGVIEEFADDMALMAQQPKPNPEQVKAEAEAEALKTKTATEAQSAQADNAERMANAQKTTLEAQSKAQADDLAHKVKEQKEWEAAQERAMDLGAKQKLLDAEFDQKAQKHKQDMEIGMLQLDKLRLEIGRVQVQTDATIATTNAKIDQTNVQTENTIKTTDASVQAAADSTAIKKDQAEHGAEMNERAAALAERQAAKEPA